MQNSLQLSAVDSVNILYQIGSKLLNMVIFCAEFGECRLQILSIAEKPASKHLCEVDIDHGRNVEVFVFLCRQELLMFLALVSLSASEVNLVYGPPRAGIRSLRQTYGALYGEPVRLTSDSHPA